MARTHQHHSANRGRAATRPGELPKAGWRDVLLRTWRESSDDNVSLVSAGVAFYGLLAVFPALAALVSIYGLVADPGTVQEQVDAMAGVIPEDARQILDEQMSAIAARSGAALSIGAIGGLLLTIWSATKGVKSLMTALNIVYDEDERRGFLKLNAIALLLMVGALLMMVVALSMVVALPALLGSLGLGGATQTLVSLLRWPLLFAVVILGLAVLFRFGPSRERPRWRWVTWGSAVGTLLWLVASMAFSYYVANFGNYNETYGSVGAVVILLMWFYLSAYIVLMAAELNAEMEHQTRRDTTSGEPEPLGSRGAHVADTVGDPQT